MSNCMFEFYKSNDGALRIGHLKKKKINIITEDFIK